MLDEALPVKLSLALSQLDQLSLISELNSFSDILSGDLLSLMLIHHLPNTFCLPGNH